MVVTSAAFVAATVAGTGNAAVVAAASAVTACVVTAAAIAATPSAHIMPVAAAAACETMIVRRPTHGLRADTGVLLAEAHAAA